MNIFATLMYFRAYSPITIFFEVDKICCMNTDLSIANDYLKKEVFQKQKRVEKVFFTPLMYFADVLFYI